MLNEMFVVTVKKNACYDLNVTTVFSLGHLESK